MCNAFVCIHTMSTETDTSMYAHMVGYDTKGLSRQCHWALCDTGVGCEPCPVGTPQLCPGQVGPQRMMKHSKEACEEEGSRVELMRR